MRSICGCSLRDACFLTLSSFYRILKKENLLNHRGKSSPKQMIKPTAFEVYKPNELYSWDITYLLSSIRGHFFIYIYLWIYFHVK